MVTHRHTINASVDVACYITVLGADVESGAECSSPSLTSGTAGKKAPHTSRQVAKTAPRRGADTLTAGNLHVISYIYTLVCTRFLPMVVSSGHKQSPLLFTITTVFTQLLYS